VDGWVDLESTLIGVSNGERGDSSPVGRRQRLDADLAAGCGLVERGFGGRASSSSRQAVWSGSLLSAAASGTPVSTTSVSD
jgi:hypothetical protein